MQMFYLKFAPEESGTGKSPAAVWDDKDELARGQRHENKLLTNSSRDSAVIITQLPLITAVCRYCCIYYCFELTG